MKNSSVDKVLLGYYDMISLFDMMSLFGKRTTEHKKISLSRKECHGCCYLPQINQRTLLIIPEESHILNGMLISLLFFSSKCNFYIFFFAHYWLQNQHALDCLYCVKFAQSAASVFCMGKKCNVLLEGQGVQVRRPPLVA